MVPSGKVAHSGGNLLMGLFAIGWAQLREPIRAPGAPKCTCGGMNVL